MMLQHLYSLQSLQYVVLFLGHEVQYRSLLTDQIMAAMGYVWQMEWGAWIHQHDAQDICVMRSRHTCKSAVK